MECIWYRTGIAGVMTFDEFDLTPRVVLDLNPGSLSLIPHLFGDLTDFSKPVGLAARIYPFLGVLFLIYAD